ncbi:uncharacterized protein ANIA_11400 [Aspergillus nidulans FGSC A4]|uniref:Uncharacterized protein n=1 Tax=Emericella nidulans (strain FGSC A4 / ATCC 38163 / CBS 112.46 / NRRL 194 / M139) TaxID=227321 RepID=C8V4S4_EMENI|nr:hypothetical protein [Aspergillus nidulans FGSC A4]CBF75944.1 TPA: hypothetical protein ANIA_11400 [Aspergillus nidulans FGSC A4]
MNGILQLIDQAQSPSLILGKNTDLQKKIITLCCVFTTEDTTEGYYTIFKKVYNIMHKLTGKKLTFYAIHGTGLHAIGYLSS